MPEILYKEKDLNRKADKLATMFPTISWEDMHELVPQIMEIIECLGMMRDNSNGEDKKATTIVLVNRVLDRSTTVDGIRESVPGLIDVICGASKGKYALNKEQKYEEVL